MYLTKSMFSPPVAPATVRTGRWVAGNVVALGAVSLVTDLSAEMVTAVLPLYLVVGLGLSPLQFGLLDGLHSGLTAVSRLVGGHAGDRWQRRKAVAGVGYALSAVSRLGMLAAGGSVTWIGAAIGLDRAGKGLRTAPRDSMLALSADPARLGAAFGVHRAMDTAGALLGPLAAAGLLAAAGGAYDAVFVVSFCVGAFGLVLLALFVRDRRDATPAPDTERPTIRAALAQLARPEFRLLCLVAAGLGAVTIGDGFVYLLLRQRTALEAQYLVLLPLGSAACFLLLAAPLGRLADRIGRGRMLLAGHGALLGAYVLLLVPAGSLGLIAAVVALHGAFYAATDGVLMAAAGAVLPGRLCGSGMAMLQTGHALARFAAAVVFGAVWTAWGATPALLTAAIALTVALVASARALRLVRGEVLL